MFDRAVLIIDRRNAHSNGRVRNIQLRFVRVNHMHGVDKVLEVKQRPIAPPSPVPKREGM